MRLLCNPEWKHFLAGYGAGALSFSAGGCLFGPLVGIYVFVICGCLLWGFWYMTWRRYQYLQALSLRLDGILHGDDSLDFVPDQEGELAVLSGKIYKMTIRLREQAELLQKEKGYLKEALANISHQMKTPLTSLRLMFGKTTDRELKQEAGNLLTRMEWLMDVLLKTAKLESGTTIFSQSNCSVREIFEKALEPLKILMEIRGVEVVLSIPAETTLVGDAYWLLEAFGNLLKNGLDYTPPGGQIIVTAEDNPIYTKITIQDTGEGFTVEDLPHLFERFYRGSHVTTTGIGIGLSLAEQIIRQQNGTIQAENCPEGGARFVIRFYKRYTI